MKAEREHGIEKITEEIMAKHFSKWMAPINPDSRCLVHPKEDKYKNTIPRSSVKLLKSKDKHS